MSDRNRNQLPNNLPQLQNLIKRDPESYVEEVTVNFSGWTLQILSNPESANILLAAVHTALQCMMAIGCTINQLGGGGGYSSKH